MDAIYTIRAIRFSNNLTYPHFCSLFVHIKYPYKMGASFHARFNDIISPHVFIHYMPFAYETNDEYDNDCLQKSLSHIYVVYLICSKNP